MDKTKKWRKILAMMLTIVMMLQNAQSVMVFADVTNEQIEQRLAGGQTQTEQQQPDQSQVETRANGEEYKTQPQESTDNGNDGVDIGSPETSGSTTEAKTSNADVSAKITQSVFQADVSGVTCNFVQMTAEITNNDTENAATGVNIKALLLSSQLSYVTDYGTLTSGVEAYVPDSNNTSDLPDGSADGYDQIVMWTNQTIGAGETVAYQFAAQFNAENLDGVVDAWYVDGTSCNYTWENTEVLNPVQTPEADQEETPSDTTQDSTQDSNQDSNQDANQDSTQEAIPTPEVTEETTATPTPEVTETPEATPTPEVTEEPEETPTPEVTPVAEDDKKAKVAKKKQQQKLLAQRGMEDKIDTQDADGGNSQPVAGEENGTSAKSKNIADNPLKFKYYFRSPGTATWIEWTSNTAVPRDAEIKIYLEYAFTETNKPTASDATGYWWTLPTLPQELVGEVDSSGFITDPTNDEAGTYRIENGKVYFDFYPTYISGKDSIVGTFSMLAHIDKDKSQSDKDITIDLGNVTWTVPLTEPSLQGDKTYEVQSDGTILFKIKLEAQEGNVTNVNVVDELTGKWGFTGWYEVLDSDNNKVNATMTIDSQNSQRATFTVSEIKYNKPVTIYYKVNPNGTPGGTGTDSNTATWTYSKGTGTGVGTGSGTSGSVTVDHSKHKLNKSSQINNVGQVEYKIKINEFAEKLLDNGGKITLEDKMSDNVTLIRSSIKITNARNNADLLNDRTATYNYDPENHKLTFTVPDETYVLITYKVAPKGKIGSTITVTNDAHLTGTLTDKSGTSEPVVVKESSATIRGTNGTTQFKKLGKYPVNGQIPTLNGVKFKLYTLSLDEYQEEGSWVQDAESQNGGEVKFGFDGKKLSTGQLYYFIEDETIDGYIKDTRRTYFMLISDNASEAEEAALKRKVFDIYGNIDVQYVLDGAALNDVSNNKKPDPVRYSFSATKKLDNNDISTDLGFKFNMKLTNYQKSGDYNVDVNIDDTLDDSTTDALSLSNSTFKRYNVEKGIDSDGRINFSDINFIYEGIYTFEISEVLQNNPKYVYDSKKYTAIVVVGRGTDGNLIVNSAKVTPDSIGEMVFNNYTSTGLTITKKTETSVDTDTEFKFKLTGADFSGLAVDGNTGTVESRNGNEAIVKATIPANSNTVSVKLKGLLKNAAITVEEIDTPSGWHLRAYEPAGTDGKNATITLSDQESKNVVKVNNYYKETGEATFKVRKNFNGWTDNPNQEFTFSVTPLGNDIGNVSNPMPEQQSTITFKSDNSKTTNVTKTFGKLSFERLGNYYYKITETIPPNVDSNYRTNGITYDPKVTYIKVNVVKGSNGKSTVNLYVSDPRSVLETETATSIDAVVKEIKGSEVTASFTNSVSEAGITFKVTKKLTGRALNADEFTFVLANVDKTQTIQTAKNDANGNITFNPIAYKSTDAGQYTYTIYEQYGGDTKNGVKYDNTAYTVTVNVSQNADGTLKITCNDDTEDWSGRVYTIPKADGKEANFVNEYSASTSIQFTGIKELQNKELPDSNKQFEFSIEGHNIKNGKATVSNIGRKIEFPIITYTEEDLKENETYLESKQYDYTVTEVEPADAVDHKKAGIKYDTNSYTVHVVLSRNDKGGLKTTVTVGDNTLVGKGTNPSTYALTGDQSTFVNVYEANDIQVKLVGNKKLENQKLIDGKYNFKIEPYNSGTPASTINGALVVSNTVSENKNITFPNLKITLNDMKGTNGYPASEKTFQYLISEVAGSESGVTYSKERYLVKIEVTNTDGRLAATGTVEKIQDKDGKTVNNVTKRFSASDTEIPEVDIANGTDAFTNTYNAETTVQFKGTKSLVDTLGKAKSVSGRNFEFKIFGPKLGENGANGTETVSANDNGTFEFPEINYDVTDLKYEDGNYTSKEFEYTITEVMPKDETGADTNVKDGVTYDDKTSYNVVVTVTNDIKTGTLTQTVALAGNSPEKQRIAGNVENNKGVYTLSAGENKATFTNVYDATTEYSFKVVKRLAGREFKDGDNFKFELLKGRQHIQTISLEVGQAGTEIKTDADGNKYLEASFAPQKYGLKDVNETYEYTIRELNPGTAMEGVTIDDDIYIVDITVTDNNDGTLTATAKRILGDDENDKVDFENAVFINTYKAEGTAQIVAKKFLSPGDIGAEKFTFTLTQIDKDGTVVEGGISQTKQNEGNSIIFDPIAYHQKGEKDAGGNIVQTSDAGKTFWYEVKETAGTDTKYTYDNKVYKVKVDVSIDPKDNRKLVTTQTIYDATGKETSEIGEKAEAIVFTNRYEATGAITLTGKKVVEGEQKLTAKEFNFEVKEGVGENAKVVATGTNDEDGNIQFSEIKYAYNSETNDLGEHIYTVTEVQPKDGDGYVYDLTSRKVVVKVTDNKDNTLKAEIIAASEKDSELKSDVTDKVINSFNNKKISVTIRKTDAKGEKLAGAGLTLYEYDNEKKGDAVDTWETKADADHTITGKLIAGKTYILEETKVPDGYAKANPIIFTVKNDDTRTIEMTSGQLDKDGNVVMVDQKTGVQILKVDANGKGVKDAQLAVYDGDKKIDEWTSDGDPHAMEGLVAGHKYTLKELKAPAGYKKATDQEFEVSDSKVVEVRMVDKLTKVSIMKVDANGQGLKGAVLELRDSTGKMIDHWESDGKEHVLEGELIEGATYTLSEVSAPEGYTLAKPKTFEVSAKDDVTKVTMENIPNSVIISKKSLTGVNSIAGAVLRVVDAQGKEVVSKWTTEAGKDKVVTGVFKPNTTYTLEEISAPAGYRKADNITFSLNEAGEIFVNNEKVTSVVMRDAMTKASILKTDESGKALSGAQLVVKDSTGKELDKWTSDGKAHEITGLLTVGETYTLSEVSAPSGYTVAPDQTFKMEDKDVIEVTMVDYQASGSGQITVTKKVTFANGGDFTDLIAQDDTFYVNLFTDAAGKYPYKGALPQAIHLVNASAGSVTFSDLAQGTYYVYETDANGNVIDLDQQGMHNGSQFMCTVDGGSNTVKLDLKAGPKEGAVNLENVFFDIPTGYSYKGEININKQVLKGTTQTTTDDTFYAGIFTKGDDGVYNLFTVVQLVQNDTVTVEVPLGGENGTEPINYYILETDADGNILDLDVFEYEVTGEGTVALSKENLTGNINLVNKIPEESDGKLRVQKTDGNGVGLAGASFRLTDEDGTVVDEWTSEASAHELELEPGTYTLTEVQAPTGYTGAGSVTIEVDDDYNFSVDGEIEYSYNNGLLKIVNKVVPSDSATPGTSGGGGSTPASYSAALSGKVAVKTGDNTPIGAYAAVLVIAALAIAGGIFYKKKRKNDK